MKTLFVTSEAYPFAMSGGLGDVSSALPKALRQRFIGCRVVLPLYGDTPAELVEGMTFVTSLSVPVSWRRQYCGVFETKHDGVTYYLLDNQYYFKRSGLYGFYDDAERFAFLARAVLEMLPYINFYPDVIHCNDWQTALTPVYYKLFYSANPGYTDIKTILTIHNIQYQGQYGREILEDVFGIPNYQMNLLEYDGCINLLKGGIECADAVTTVSPTYAQEILDPWYSCGLNYILEQRREKISGIVNGIDTDLYDPKTDPSLFVNYTAEDVFEKKAVNKQKLQELLGLEQRPDVPLCVMVSRLVAHKGMDLVKYVFEELMSHDIQMAMLGTGDWVYESYFDEMAGRWPGKFSFTKGFLPELSHRFYAGADLFLMPSKSEPCGLAQMVALRYGTIPVVRKTGGLSDTITDCGDAAGNGFTFQSFNAHDMAASLYRAAEQYRSQPNKWKALVQRAMECDNSWKRSAGEYIKLYKSLLLK